LIAAGQGECLRPDIRAVLRISWWFEVLSTTYPLPARARRPRGPPARIDAGLSSRRV